MKLAVSAFVLLFSMLALWSQVPASKPAEPEKPPPPQPIPFNHKVHATTGVKCLDCHPIRGEGFEAGYPQEATCMGCHTSIKADSPDIQKLAGFAKARKPVPWVKIYKVPEYVWFSHASHVKDAELGCELCHGPVAEREVIVKEKPTSMVACMTCHDKYSASNACDLCHNSQ